MNEAAVVVVVLVCKFVAKALKVVAGVVFASAFISASIHASNESPGRAAVAATNWPATGSIPEGRVMPTWVKAAYMIALELLMFVDVNLLDSELERGLAAVDGSAPNAFETIR